MSENWRNRTGEDLVVSVIRINPDDVMFSLPDDCNDISANDITRRDLIQIADEVNRSLDEEFWDMFSTILARATKRHFNIK